MNEGSTATLTCNADANPAVDSYTWYKVDGDEVTAVGSRKKLSTTVSEADSKFFCQVSNKHGAQNSSITEIDVHCELDHSRNTIDQQRSINSCFLFVFPVAPKDTTVVVDAAGPLLEGSSVSLSCSSRANPPVTNFTWYRGDEEEEERGQTLVLNNLDLAHSIDYHCQAKNDLGEEDSATIQLDIQCMFTVFNTVKDVLTATQLCVSTVHMLNISPL